MDLSDGAFTYAVTNPNNVPVTYSSSNEGVATVDNNGQVTPKTAGATTISAEFAGSDKFSAQTAKYELTVTDKANAYTLSTIKNVITETEGTYSLKFDNAVISYVNGKNAYIEDKNGAILFYAENAYQAGEVFNGVATVKAKDYNGTKELTSIDITPTKGGTIPLTTVTAEELSKNIAQYEYRRVKIVGATLATAFTDRKANIEQKGTTIELFNKNTKIEKELEKIAAGSTLDVIGFAGTYNGKAQLNVWETSDITEANPLPSPELSFAEATKTVDLSEGSFTNALKNDNGVTVTYSSSDEKVATVDQSGKVSPLAAGTTTISAAFAGNETYKAQTVSYELTVKDKSVATGTIDEITVETINNPNSSYADVKGITVENGSGAVYAAYTYGYNKKCIQIKKKDDVSGLVTTTSAGKVKSVTITWNSETKNGRKLNIYGKNTAYSLPSDLYKESLQGKLLGPLIKKAGSATSTLNINEDCAYVGILSDEYTLYIDKITIEWDNGNTPSSSVTFSTNAQDQSDNYCYGTVYSDKALKLPTEVIGSTIKYVNGKLQMDWEYDSDKTVPAGTPILVMSDNKGNHTAEVVADDTQEAPADNVLKGSATDKEVSDQNSYFYILTFSYENNAKTLGFYWQNETGHSISTKGGKAYLQLPAEPSLSAVKGFSISKGSVTGIGSISSDNEKAATIYTISGVRINAPVNTLPKGIYIVDGKKVMVK